MKAIEAYRAWALPDGTWTPWVKPVLFAIIHRGFLGPSRESPRALPTLPAWFEDEVIRPLEDAETEPAHVYRDTRRLDDVAFVIDLPSAEGTNFGVALTVHGFRPIPLYNAVPGPRAIVDVRPIIDALEEGAPHVAAVPESAPPAFLLDAQRMGKVRPMSPLYDNRSICRASDFPSAERFKAAGIRRIVLICEVIQEDLEAIALEWQAAGLEIWLKRPVQRGSASVIVMRRPWLGRRFWVLLLHQLRTPRADGAYGRLIEGSASSS